MKQKIFLDVDGVLADFSGAVINLLGLGITNDDITHWDFLLEYAGMSSDRFWSHFDDNFWANLVKKTPECDEIVKLLEEYRPCLLTSPAFIGAGGKQEWIRKNLPSFFYDGRYLIGPAKEYLAHKNAILIDDSDSNIGNWEEGGGIGILVPKPWNVAGRGMALAELDSVKSIQEGIELIKAHGIL